MIKKLNVSFAETKKNNLIDYPTQISDLNLTSELITTCGIIYSI